MLEDNKDLSATQGVQLLDVIVRALAGDSLAIIELVSTISDETYTAVQRIPYMQLKYYLDGVKNVEDDLGNACKLSDKLFGNPQNRIENAMRVYRVVSSADSQKKIDYYVNATRSFLLGLIDVEMLFRIFKAIDNSLLEDLKYLSRHIECKQLFEGSMNVHALERVGLMISAGINGNADVEKQEYVISLLGYAVDEYALSVEDECRMKWHKERSDNMKRLFATPQEISAEEVDKLFDGKFAENRKNLIDAARPKWESI